ncbi:hypothetical protein Dda_7472 [Drechslerella dactyloides]|uniref:Uncharacterized protein n=1 Tax=Drechslerella dactyloides TaxID=74499 RepID=A0AAD6ISA3_DREDA|nr:hypothetical protein Dda_7472 [Drechslerella dactyloides]
MSDKCIAKRRAKKKVPSHEDDPTPGSYEWKQRLMEGKIPLPPVKIMPRPPSPTPEQRREYKIQTFGDLIKTIDTNVFPEAQKKSMEVALRAWENREVAWVDEKAHLWGPDGLIAEGTIEEMTQIHARKVNAGNRDTYLDQVSYQPQSWS